jgi:3-dehydroquinate dehydratase
VAVRERERERERERDWVCAVYEGTCRGWGITGFGFAVASKKWYVKTKGKM